MDNAKLSPVHISQVTVGDTIELNGKLTTVCANNMKYDSFMGHSLFGDNFKSGRTPVNKVVGWIGKTGEVFPYKK